MMHWKATVAAVIAALALAACGSSNSEPKSSGRAWTIDQFLQRTGLQRQSDGLTYLLPGHPRCVARLLLRSSAEVDTYVNSGDVIATNPDKSGGVRVENGEPTSCKAVFTQALAKLK